MSLLVKNHRREKYLFRKQLLIVLTLLGVLFVILIMRLFYLQIWQHKFYTTLSEQNHLALLPIEPNRGLIYDRNGVLLAENIPVFSLDVLPNQARELEKDLPELAKVISLGADEIEQFDKIYSGKKLKPTPLKLNLTEEEVAKFYLDQYHFPELKINARLLRHYPLGESMVSVLGYTGRINAHELKELELNNYGASDFIGKNGIEKYYENILHGVTGYEQVEVDAAGHIVRTLKNKPPEAGANLYLTIDSKLQEVAKKALGNERGAVVMLAPQNGEVLALVSNPGFDPNLFVGGISSDAYNKLRNSPDKPMYNRAVRGQFAPGSTVKPFIALQGLDSGVIDVNYSIEDAGWFRLPNSKHLYRDWVKHGHGEVNVIKAIIVSCDTFFYNLAAMLGMKSIYAILDRFGFGQKTGIDIAEELAGNLPSPAWKEKWRGEHWYKGDTIVAGIGQGYMLSTPMQLAYAVATIANRGLRVRPHLLLNSKPIFDEPVILKDAKNWNIIIQGMQGVIESEHPWGTGRTRFGVNVNYPVAAKTGTVQLYHRIRNNENEAWEEANVPKRLRNHSIFIAFSPIEKPKIAIAVIVENSLIAGSAARKILDYWWNK